jgi:hypothetical protein
VLKQRGVNEAGDEEAYKQQFVPPMLNLGNPLLVFLFLFFFQVTS